MAGALAAPVGHLTATVRPDHTVEGTLRIPAHLTLESVFPLPQPEGDLALVRTFPGRVDTGEMVWEREGDHWRFETRLPRRYGAIGNTAHGLYALGGFHPVPMDGAEVATLDWVVDISLPEGELGLVGQSIGRGTVHWEGRAERVALALPRRAEVWTSPDGRVRVLGKGQPRRVFTKQLAAVLPTLSLDRPLVVVETPLRRRLHQHAPGVLFASDRYFQLTFLFASYHRPALVEGLLAADTTLTHPQSRDLVGRAQSLRWEAEHAGLGAAKVSRALSWVPTIDALLSSRRMAFFSETFREWNPSDPLGDDLVEVLQPHRSGSAVLGQVEARADRNRGWRLARAMDEGLGLAQGLQLVGMDPGTRQALTSPSPSQDYALEVGDTIVVERNAPPDAPPEMLEVRIDGEVRAVEVAPGERVDFGPGDRVVVDPRRRVKQTSRMGDAHPLERLRVVAAAGWSTVNLSQFRLEGIGAMWIRGRNDTRNQFYGSLATNRNNLAALRLSYTYKFGPIRYGITRQHRVIVGGGPGLINTRFRGVDEGRWVLSGSTSWTWSNRSASEFPVRGSLLGLTAAGGIHPGHSVRWSTLVARASTTRSPHPRHAFVFTGSAGVARSSSATRLLKLGGPGTMASLPDVSPCGGVTEGDCIPYALERGVGSVEYRVVAIRGARIPLVAAWGRELQLSTGLEAMVAGLPRGPARALGATVGVSGVYDLFGADPAVFGMTLAWSLAREGLPEVDSQSLPQVYLRWTQAL